MTPHVLQLQANRANERLLEFPRGTHLPALVCARCAHAGGLLGWLEEALPPLPFAMCFSAAEERPGGILALPNGFLKTLVSKRYGDELGRYAESVGLERIEIVVDPTVSVHTADRQPADERRQARPVRVREQPPGLTTRFFAERGFWQLSPLAAGQTRQLDDLRGQLRVEAGAQGACGTYEAMVFSGLLAVWMSWECCACRRLWRFSIVLSRPLALLSASARCITVRPAAEAMRL
jgi:hypothetical protein